MKQCTVFIAILIITIVRTENTDENYLRLPKLFHLDEYDNCLQEKNGIYCVGKFQLYSDKNSNPKYDFIQEFSKDEKKYNRTFIYRGICLSTRCPSDERNASIRLEECVDRETQAQSLRARLYKLHYCHTHNEIHTAKPMDLAKLVFLLVIAIISIMNILGTVYGYWTKNKEGYKNVYLMMWSIPVNWQKITSTYITSDPRFSNLGYMEGLRALLIVLITLVHASLAANKTYHLEPRNNEAYLSASLATYIAALTTFAQIFVLFSSFLTTYNILMVTNKNKCDIKQLPLFMLKRYLRILPIYLLCIGFSATWWPSIGNGPMWPLLVCEESDVCRRKFWPYFFFVSNIFNPGELCVLSTWVMVVDMQLHLLALFMSLVLLKLKDLGQRIRILTLLYAASAVLTFFLVYAYKFKPMFAVGTPDILMNVLANSQSFTHFYIQPYNCLIVAVSGMILGHIQHITMTKNIQVEDYKWIMRLQPFGYTSFILWPITALAFQYITDDFAMALYMTIDRVVSSICLCFCLYTSCNVKGHIKDFLSWNGWKVFGRISFCISMIHWQINLYILGISRNLYESGFLHCVILNGIGNLVLSILASLPLCILVEYPLEAFFNQALQKIVRKHDSTPNDKHK